MDYTAFKDSITLSWDACNQQFVGPVIALFILIFAVLIFLIYMANRDVQFRKFINDSKLNKKFQEWKKDNKGL